MGDSMLPEICDLVFSVLLGYAGALEFLYVIRHLYHWSCNHMAAAATQNDAGSLRHLQDRIRSDLAAAEDKERQTGMQTMKDGVLYRDGFRIDPKQLEQDRLKAEQSTPEGREKRKQEIEAELKRQLEIEEQTRQQLAEAEAKLEQQHKQQAAEKKARKAEEEEQARILLERERQREEEERKRDTEGAEAARKAAVEEELKRQRQEETEKRRKEEAEEQRRHEAELIEAAKEVDEQTQKLLEAERQREQEQQKQQIEEQEYEEERKFLEAERLHEAEQREREIREAGGESNDEQETEDEEEKLQRLKINAALTSGKLPVMSEAETLNNIMQLLNTESKRRQNEIEYELSVGREREERQKLIEENARKFLEADHDMEELLETVQKQRHYSGTESAPQSPVHEEPCLRKTVSPLSDNSPNSGSSERLTKTVKTQFGQKTQNESFSVSTKPLLFKSISDDTPSFEPQSSLSPQPSTEEYVSSADNKIDTQFAQLERQEPDGEDEDNPSASAQYTEDYLRSLDGIKQRPLVREDGSGRRRAFKKRRSSGSSNSSFDSRASRDEELKMFTSLEEEELQPKKEGETDDFTPIKYTSEQLLKVKMPRRRHKRSPAKDVKPADSAIRGSLEMLNEEANTNPWGEVTPEHYKDMPFWKKEKSMSIDEEAIELDIPATKKEIKKDVDVRIVPKSSTFEEATHTQNKEAITALQRQQTKEEQEQSQQEKQSDEATNSDIQSNLQAPQNSPTDRKSASPRLRRSPLVDEMDNYEEQWNKTNELETECASAQSGATLTTPSTPSIVVARPPDTAPWRNQHGLLMEGISDFYDFTASINPSRSRSTSRQPSPVKSQPGTPQPNNVAYVSLQESKEIIDVYDDTDNVMESDLTKANVVEFIESLPEDRHGLTQVIDKQVQNVADSPEVHVESGEADVNRIEMNLLVQTLRVERQSRSRSRSPPPTADQLSRSVKTRRNRLIEKNDKLFETLNLPTPSNESPVESPTNDSPTIVIECPETSSTEGAKSGENIKSLVAEESKQGRSRSQSPLPTHDNLQHSLETRRSKQIKQNDELSAKLCVQIDVSRTPSPIELLSDHKPENHIKAEEECMRESMNQLVDSLRAERAHLRSRSRSPLPTSLNLKTGLENRRKKKIQQNDALFQQLHIDISSIVGDAASNSKSQTAPVISIQCYDETTEGQASADIRHEEDEYSAESMTSLVESLRLQRSRSKSPMRCFERERTPETSSIRVGLNVGHLLSEREDDSKTQTAPIISIQCCDEGLGGQTSADSRYEGSEYSVESMTSLVESLRLQRSRPKSPMKRLERERTPEPSTIRVGLNIDDKLSEGEDEHERRSRTPSRSLSRSPKRARTPTSSRQSVEESEFNKLLNLEASQNRTLSKCSEEIESILAEKQRKVGAEALRKLSNAKEEIELLTVTPITTYESEDKSKLTSTTHEERLRALRCTPTTPEYERTLSQERQDVQRIKDAILTSGFKRSTYVGESLDLGSEFVPLREQTARFRRSRSPSPSLVATESREVRRERRELQDKIIAELVTASAVAVDVERLGAKPKEGRSMSKDLMETQCQELRRLNAEFKRSRSQSRSPLDEMEAQEIAKIDEEAGKRELEERMKQNLNFQEFSRYLNANFLDNERRASDSALIQKPEVFFQLQGIDEELDVEPENYHHFRRFSLNQEQPVEEYPNDDYVFVSQIEVQTPNGTRTWIREDFYSEDFEQLSLITEESGEGALTIEAVNEAAEAHLHAAEEEDTDGSEDERQTVVEVEDEIDEDICDFNERGPTDESHHEISECEEAEREMDQYADREANDWQQVENIDQLLLDEEILLAAEEGAAGGDGEASMLTYDSDSAEIDKMYDEAIKNRKPSGILRDYDSILKEMQRNYINNNVTVTTDGSEADMSGASDSDRKKGGRKDEGEATLKLIRNERQELRYLGDATETESHATRLRTRYGYAPQLHGQGVEELDIEVDLNYKPSREYNWRKNFKIDDDEDVLGNIEKNKNAETQSHATAENECLDLRKFSLGGESITLFSQNLEGVCYVVDESQLSADVIQEEKESAFELGETEIAVVEEQIERAEKPKKKKSKKKLRKETRNTSNEYDDVKDEDDSESQLYSRRSSSIQMDIDSLKRCTKSRSRRNSRNSLTNDESNLARFSPHSSAGVVDSTTKSSTSDTTPSGTKKKLKKRKKIKEADIKEESTLFGDLTVKVPTASAAVSPGTTSINPLATLSPQNSICIPSSLLDSETPDLKELISAPSSAEHSPVKQQKRDDVNDVEVRITAIADALISSVAAEAAAVVTEAATAAPAAATIATRSSTTPTTTTKATTVDTFDILKDANFYPLF
ncbi:microtubule-associated protein futsch isoform X1 [Eurosta solidaginis]|uniref:microtubule-associated protein futsch isoform X1 n=1 Tax=Eurosta solidaginis TaxID=178769 RepID=UPI0035311CDF